ncbi:unnamed protein product [Bemisia tabaci]|uniref:FACT complex subunit n=1 Tax=Bemisia tabaci TaxID=7038 RepID=A0A9P0A475_BEMTA|nr:PREDICTED: FACT complex subunit spt16 [Bemisia tabaci]CAH0383891.1 unnamed protein product [Bemisia tabaci]
MANFVIDKEAFFKRVKKLYSSWKGENGDSDETLLKADALISAVAADEVTVYCKSSALQLWLLGYELTDTVTVFTQNTIYFLASRKKIDFLRQIESAKDEAGLPSIKLLTREKNGDDSESFKKLLDAIKGSKNGKTVGLFSKENFQGAFMDSWNAALKKGNFETVDITAAIGMVMSVKDENEVAIIKKASQVSCDLFTKYLKDEIMDIIDADKKVRHDKLASGVESAIADKKYIGSIDPSQLDMCYPAIIQSGGNYSLKFSASSDKNNLHFGVIVCSVGARYKSYCSNIVRTLLVNPTSEIKDNYVFLCDLFEKLLTVLQAGTKLCDVYEAGVSFAKETKPDFVDHLTKNFGFAMGIEFRESSLLIAPKTTTPARKNQIYNLNVGLAGLANKEASDKEGKTYAFFIGDTVLVNENAPATLLTASAKKKQKSVTLEVKDENDEEEDEEEENKENKPKQDAPITGRGKRSAVLDQKLRMDSSNEAKRKEHQKALGIALNEKAKQRLAAQSGGKQEERVRKSNVSYKNRDQFPRNSEIKSLKIFVDSQYETVVLPIHGIPVPFHISTIKNISQSVEGDYTYLRVNFFHLAPPSGRGDSSSIPQPDSIFVKEVTYRSTNIRQPGEAIAPSSNLNTAFRLIKEVQKKFKTREAEEKEKEDLVKQDSLVLSQSKGNPKLKGLFIRPNIVNKRMSGTLEAHVNGFRYTSLRGDKVDILYNNIKHAFFQPCDGEMIILLHFHLKNAIMFGKKKHLDVQFYTEVGEITTDLGKHQHMHDRDDLAAEQSERELRHKLKAAFKSFCEKVESATKQEIEFETPFRELGFLGAPFRSTVLLQPTAGCLINLTEWPPFVVTLEDIELVHFERVQFQLKNFDMVFVFKDYHHKVAMVSAIPMNLLDHVKEWLNSCDIRYTEGVQTLNWAKILKTIIDDPESFFETGGWTFLDPESDDEAEAEDEEEEEDDAYEPTDLDDDDEESDEDSDYSEVSEDDDDDSEEELGSSDESGKDWSDLEREAAEEDKEKMDFEDEYSSSKKGGRHGHHKSSKGSSSSSRHHSSSHKSSHSSSHKSPSKSSSSHRHSSSSSKSKSSSHHSSSSKSPSKSSSHHSSSSSKDRKRSHDDKSHKHGSSPKKSRK